MQKCAHFIFYFDPISFSNNFNKGPERIDGRGIGDWRVVLFYQHQHEHVAIIACEQAGAGEVKCFGSSTRALSYNSCQGKHLTTKVLPPASQVSTASYQG